MGNLGASGVWGAVAENATVAALRNLVQAIRARGVEIWVENGGLRYRGPEGALSSGELESLKAHRSQLLSGLSGDAYAYKEGIATGRLSPLAFSQLAHWNGHRLGSRRVLRGVASATRLYGPLQEDSFAGCVRDLIRRHEALRTQILLVDGTPMQQVDSLGRANWAVDLHTRSPLEVRAAIRETLLVPIDVTRDPLHAIRLFRIRKTEHVLLIATEHVVSDGYSLNVLLRDLLAMYVNCKEGQRIVLPPVQVQLADFANSQWLEPEAARIRASAMHWQKHLDGFRRATLHNESAELVEMGVWNSAGIALGPALTKKLRTWAAYRGTSVALCVFSVFIATVSRWSGQNEVIVKFQADGRLGVELENSVGYFANQLYVPVRLAATDTFEALLVKVTAALCQGYQWPDASYLAAQPHPPEFSKCCFFNWIPAYSGAGVTADGSLEFAPFELDNPIFEHTDFDNDPGVILYETEGNIAGEILSQGHQLPLSELRRQSETLVRALERLTNEPNERILEMLELAQAS